MALIISPWNFPLLLALGPLVTAIAAGNCAVVKPSELTPATSALITEIISDVFDENEVAVFEGGSDIAQSLLRRRWDHIFFTGSTAVGKIVMKAAAEHLTPVTLELGGKSPAIIDRTADLDLAARRIAWGKCINAGQVCVAPDYVLVERSVELDFLVRLRRELEAQYGDGDDGRRLTSIVNERHFERVGALVDEAIEQGAELVTGGTRDGKTREVRPTVLRRVPEGASILNSEIFGPVLPVLTWDHRDEAISFINERPKPLALYVFTNDSKWKDRVLAETSAGGGCINDVVSQFSQVYLPFGGVGDSGMGSGHGEAGFRTFSNPRGVLQQRRWSLTEVVMPPFTPIKRWVIDVLVRWF